MIKPAASHVAAQRLLLVLVFGFLIAPFCCAHLYAQGVDQMGTGGRHRIQGRIYFPSGRRSDTTNIKVTLESTSSERIFVIADMNGSFTFNNLAEGNYTITVDAGAEYEQAKESVLIEGASAAPATNGVDVSRANVPRTFSVMINLQPKPVARNKAAVVNAALSSVPKEAADAYRAAIESAKAGDTRKAIDELKSALSLYPNFVLALNELGVQYLKVGETNKAVDALRNAVALQPDDFTPRLNYGIALLEAKNSAAAEEQLRLAVAKNGSSWSAHMYLGVALIGLRRMAEAEQELLRAIDIGGRKVGLPHYWLGGIYWQRNEYARAASELEQYLQLVPNAPNAEKIRGTIKELLAKQSSPKQ
jgi:tetratricopeptide (TPR) repeat protein